MASKNCLVFHYSDKFAQISSSSFFFSYHFGFLIELFLFIICLFLNFTLFLLFYYAFIILYIAIIYFLFFIYFLFLLFILWCFLNLFSIYLYFVDVLILQATLCSFL